MIPPNVNEFLQSKTMQIALAASLVLVVGTVMFALVYSIWTGQPLNATASNILSLMIGAASYGIGSQSGAKHFQNGAKEGVKAVQTTAVTSGTGTGGGGAGNGAIVTASGSPINSGVGLP